MGYQSQVAISLYCPLSNRYPPGRPLRGDIFAFIDMYVLLKSLASDYSYETYQLFLVRRHSILDVESNPAPGLYLGNFF